MSRVIKRDMNYSPKNVNRRLHIYLPDMEEGERYPVMYFFDGHNLFFDEDATYGKSWGLKKFMDGFGKKMIIVGLECGHEGYERLSEYLPFKAFRGKLFMEQEPMGDATLRWILEEVKPLIDREYPTIPFRECTGIAGSSMGGLMALYGVTHYNNWFSKAACLSSAIGVCYPSVMNDMKACPADPDTRVFLSWGTAEAKGIEDVWAEDRHSGTYRRNKAAANKLLGAKASAMLYCQIGGRHCEADWEKQIPVFMDYLWLQ